MLYCLILAWRDEVEGISRAGGVLKAILTVEQGDGHQGAVVLWGAALSWLQRLDRNKGVYNSEVQILCWTIGAFESKRWKSTVIRLKFEICIANAPHRCCVGVQDAASQTGCDLRYARAAFYSMGHLSASLS